MMFLCNLAITKALHATNKKNTRDDKSYRVFQKVVAENFLEYFISVKYFCVKFYKFFHLREILKICKWR